jgi:hypothetical protein
MMHPNPAGQSDAIQLPRHRDIAEYQIDATIAAVHNIDRLMRVAGFQDLITLAGEILDNPCAHPSSTTRTVVGYSDLVTESRLGMAVAITLHEIGSLLRIILARHEFTV